MVGCLKDADRSLFYTANTAGDQEKFSPSQKVNMVLILVKMAEEWLL